MITDKLKKEVLSKRIALHVLLCIVLTGCDIKFRDKFDCSGVENMAENLVTCIDKLPEDYRPSWKLDVCKEALQELLCKRMD